MCVIFHSCYFLRWLLSLVSDSTFLISSCGSQVSPSCDFSGQSGASAEHGLQVPRRSQQAEPVSAARVDATGSFALRLLGLS